MSTPPIWVLAIMYWLHMLATVTWIGSLVAINMLILPTLERTLKPFDQLSFISAMQKRFEPLIWFSISLQLVTGLIQMSTSPHYDGYLSLSTQWSMAILAKHVFGAIMIVISAIQTWEVFPAIQRVLMKKENAEADQPARLQRRDIVLLRINLGLAVLVLGATAIARVA